MCQTESPWSVSTSSSVMALSEGRARGCTACISQCARSLAEALRSAAPPLLWAPVRPSGEQSNWPLQWWSLPGMCWPGEPLVQELATVPFTFAERSQMLAVWLMLALFLGILFLPLGEVGYFMTYEEK